MEPANSSCREDMHTQRFTDNFAADADAVTIVCYQCERRKTDSSNQPFPSNKYWTSRVLPLLSHAAWGGPNLGAGWNLPVQTGIFWLIFARILSPDLERTCFQALPHCLCTVCGTKWTFYGSRCITAAQSLSFLSGSHPSLSFLSPPPLLARAQIWSESLRPPSPPPVSRPLGLHCTEWTICIMSIL